jgi:hypothetical protein
MRPGQANGRQPAPIGTASRGQGDQESKPGRQTGDLKTHAQHPCPTVSKPTPAPHAEPKCGMFHSVPPLRPTGPATPRSNETCFQQERCCEHQRGCPIHRSLSRLNVPGSLPARSAAACYRLVPMSSRPFWSPEIPWVTKVVPGLLHPLGAVARPTASSSGTGGPGARMRQTHCPGPSVPRISAGRRKKSGP